MARRRGSRATSNRSPRAGSPSPITSDRRRRCVRGHHPPPSRGTRNGTGQGRPPDPAARLRCSSVEDFRRGGDDHTEQIGDRGQAGDLQRPRGHDVPIDPRQRPGRGRHGHYGGPVPEAERPPGRRVDAHVGHKPGEHQIAAGLQAEVQVRAGERVRNALTITGSSARGATRSTIRPISARMS